MTLSEQEINKINTYGQKEEVKKEEKTKRPIPKGWIPHRKCPKVIPKYDKRINKKGETVLEIVGEIDAYEEIQARGECVEIKDILKKYKLNSYDFPQAELDENITDMTQLPDDYTEQQNTIAKVKNTFSMLSKEDREMFKNNVNLFVSSVLEGKDNELMSKLYEKHKPITNEINNPGTTQNVNPETTQNVNPETTQNTGVKYE